MSRRGTWLLERLRFQYCDWQGASRGLREFVEQQLPAFKAANPQIQVGEVVKRSRFPFIEAQYKTHRHTGPVTRAVGVKHLTPAEIAEHVKWLRSSSGRTTSKRIPPSHKASQRASIQGRWTPELFPAQPQGQGQGQQQQQHREL